MEQFGKGAGEDERDIISTPYLRIKSSQSDSYSPPPKLSSSNSP